MKTRRIRTELIVAVITVILTTTWALWPAHQVLAFQDREINAWHWGFPPGQTARITVLNSGDDRGFHWGVKFLDAAGRILAQTREPMLVTPGHMSSHDFSADEHDLVRDRFDRTQIRAVLVVFQSNPNEITRNLQFVLEVFDDATGKTTFTQRFCANNW